MPDPSRALIIFILLFGSTPAFAAIKDTLTQLDAAKTSLQWTTANDLLRKASKADEPALRDYVADKSKDGRKRFMAFKALVRLMPPLMAREELKSALSAEKDPLFRTDCVREMGRRKDLAFKNLLRNIVADNADNGMVRAAAGEALAILGDDFGKARAMADVMSGAPWADFGARTLETLKATDVLPTLEDHAHASQKYAEKNACKTTALRIRLATSLPSERLRLLKGAMAEADAPETRSFAARALGEQGTSEAAKVLAEIARDKNAPGHFQAKDGLSVGMQQKRWTKSDVESWLKN